MAKWLLLDGYNLAFRAFYGMPELTRTDGFPTGALHGWVRTIWRLIDLEKPDGGTVVFFDLSGSREREALHEDYKANRKETPEPLKKQIPVIRELTRAMGLVGVELEGVESDDLLAAEARSLAMAGHDILIVSTDKDFGQCVNERIKILLPPTANTKLGWRQLDATGVQEKFGVLPVQIAEYLAIMGDTSDNIPGINGVGPKTASNWLDEYGSLEAIIACAAELKPERFRSLVAAHAGDLRRNLKLTTLQSVTVAPLMTQGEVVVEKLFQILEHMEMKSTLVEARKRYPTGGQNELF